MLHYFFIGNIRGNSGPVNVNKRIVNNLTEKFDYLHSSSTLSKMIEATWNTLWSDVIIVSGISRCGVYMMKIARIFNKKCIYIMHGCAELESILNELPANPVDLQYEREILKMADLILPVSQKYSTQMKKRYPEYKSKFKYLNNGVIPLKITNCGIERIPDSVIAVGGDRKLKNNATVAKAMDKAGLQGKLSVYGYIHNPGNLPQVHNLEFKGLVPQEELYRQMMASELFVLNSLYESFGLSVFDALLCGCSILIANTVGSLDLLDVTEHDIIYNPMDVDEIADKIKYLLKHPNNKRIMKSLDLDSLSYKKEVKQLENFCNQLANNR